MGQETVQPTARKSGRRIVLSAVLVLVVVGAVAGVLFEAPANAQISIRDPPQQSYDPAIRGIFVTFTSIEVHVANAGNNGGWTTVNAGATVNLLAVLNVSQVLGKASLPAGKYTELRFNVSKVVITLSALNVTYNIPSGSLKVPITNGGFQAYGALTVNIELDLSFRNNEILSNPTLTLNPVATAKVT